MKFGAGLRSTALLAAAFALTGPLGATTLYYTDFSARQILTLDTGTKATSLVDNVPVAAAGNPDSLIFESSGRIVYTIYNGSPGEVRVFDPLAHTDTLLASGFGGQLVDTTLEPSLSTILVSDRDNNTIDRVNLTSGTVTTLGSAGAFSGPNGLAFDGSGNLYAAVGSGISQIDPITGAIIKSGGNPVDGLTYDSVSNKLWGAESNCIYSFDLATLTSSGCISVTGSSSNDGIVSDGAGHLFIASSGNALVYQYTLSGGAIAAVSNDLSSLDDIAPASGLGAPPSVPEPGTLVLLSGGLGILALIRRKKTA